MPVQLTSPQALAIAGETGDRLVLAKSLSYLGLVDQVDGNLVESDRKLEKALRISEEENFRDSMAQCQTGLAANANWRGEFEKALVFCRQGELTATEIHDGFYELIGLSFRCLALTSLGEPRQAVSLLEETLVRVEKFAFGAHRWRWGIHLLVYLGEALLALGEPEQALSQVEKALVQARATGSMKYVARCHALRGEIALRAGHGSPAEADLAEALRIARAIRYPTLTWQAAHLLARARAATAHMEAAVEVARLAAETIDGVAARIPDPALKRTFLAWPRVQAALDERSDLERGARLRPWGKGAES